MTRRVRAIAFLCCALAISCVSAHTQIRGARMARPAPVLSAIDPQHAAATMASLAGVSYEKPVEVRVLDVASFVARLHAHDRETRFGGPTEAFWRGFHFAPVGDPLLGARSAVDDAVVGFYDRTTDELFVRSRPTTGAEQQFTLVHEIAHSVQERMGVLGVSSSTVDESIARGALIEGSANLLAAAYMAEKAGRSVGVSIARIRDRIRKMSAADLARTAGMPGSVVQAAPLVRARLFFPYVEGTALATALYQSGGISLVNEALAHPPVSTEQVLHPEKYFAGEQPIPVPTPIVQDRPIMARGTLGELQTAVYLAQCLGDGPAREAVEGWGGDAYAVVLDPHGDPAVLWSTVWDDEDAAARFERALGTRATCAVVARRAPRTLRRGARVAVVDATDGTSFDLEGLLARVQTVPALAPPLGDAFLRTVPPPEPQFLNKGRFSGTSFFSDALGIEVPMPIHASADAPRVGSELTFSEPLQLGGRVVGILFFVFEPVTAEFERDFADTATMRLLGARKDAFVHRDAYVVRLPIGMADLELVDTRGGGLLTAAFVPACGGEATLILVGARRGAVFTPPDGWFDDVKLATSSPACTYLEALELPEGGPTTAANAMGAATVLTAFNIKSARGRLAAVAETARECKGSGPTGRGQVVITFAPTGAPESVGIHGPPFEGTEVGDCVIERFKAARVPAFEGPPLLVTKSFVIQ